MSSKLESKINSRIYIFLLAALVVLIFLVGFVYAVAIGLMILLLWKAYGWYKLRHFIKTESDLSRKMMEYISDRLNEGTKSQNRWIQALATPEMSSSAGDYRVCLMAQEKVFEIEGKDLISGWTDWAATRANEYLKEHIEELDDNVGTPSSPITMHDMITERVELEMEIAAEALKILGVKDPAGAIGQAVDQVPGLNRSVMISECARKLLSGEIRINNEWVDKLKLSDQKTLAADYHTSLASTIETLESNDPIESWTSWGASRLDAIEATEHNMDSEEYRSAIAKAAFEVIVAEYALKIRRVKNPRGTIAQRVTANSLEEINRMRNN